MGVSRAVVARGHDHAWAPPPTELSIGGDDVHVWRARLDVGSAAVAELTAGLSPQERARALRFAFERPRRRFVARRGSLRCILGAYLGVPPHRVRFEQDAHGKPRLDEGSARSGIRFNLTHSGDFALVAVVREREVGVDVEEIRPLRTADEIAERWFAPGERRRLRELPESERLIAFYECWTLKEAYLKACGLGLAMPLDSFEVEVGPGVSEALVSVAGKPEEGKRWSSSQVRPEDSYAGSIVVEGRKWQLSTWELDDGSATWPRHL